MRQAVTDEPRERCEPLWDEHRVDDPAVEGRSQSLPSCPIDSLTNDENTERKILGLRMVLSQDPFAADLKWSLFVAACNTYRRRSCLMPFPPFFTKNESRDIEALRLAVEAIPPLAIVYQRLEETDASQKYGAAIQLLYWVLVQSAGPHISSVDKKLYTGVLQKVPSNMSIQGPNLIFQVEKRKNCVKEERWRVASRTFSTFYAYHGSRLENFHSLLHYGLQKTMCKRGLFGDGIYLSSELGVSLPYSPVGYGWGGSILGSELSCVALCEVINHPEVKRGDKGEEGRNVVEGSVGGKIPKKYYFVQNSEVVRIRYLLVYSQGFSTSKKSNDRGLVAWFKRNKMLTFVLGYAVLLASVGLTQNKHVEKIYRLVTQKIGFQ